MPCPSTRVNDPTNWSPRRSEVAVPTNGQLGPTEGLGAKMLQKMWPARRIPPKGKDLRRPLWVWPVKRSFPPKAAGWDTLTRLGSWLTAQ
jgi:hypothetical protein